MAAKAKPDLSEFFKHSRPKRRPCRVGYAMENELSKEDAEALQAAMDTDKNMITAGAIVIWLKSRGLEEFKSASSIVGHRKHTCTCYD